MEMKKMKKSDIIGSVVTLVSVVVIVVVGIAFYHSMVEKDKEDAIRVEQARKNVKIAEELIEKEFDKDKKYFRIATTGVAGYYLYTNTEYRWFDSDLKAVAEFDDSEYTVRFDTKEVNKELELYEPVRVSKVLKK